jgi:hypothetical protein
VNQTRPTVLEVLAKAIVTHTVTYFIMGLLASAILDYAGFFSQSSLSVMMRPTNDLWVMLGPLFQPIRGSSSALCSICCASPSSEGRPDG